MVPLVLFIGQAGQFGPESSIYPESEKVPDKLHEMYLKNVRRIWSFLFSLFFCEYLNTIG